MQLPNRLVIVYKLSSVLFLSVRFAVFYVSAITPALPPGQTLVPGSWFLWSTTSGGACLQGGRDAPILRETPTMSSQYATGAYIVECLMGQEMHSPRDDT
jgi:hypothetical protein